MKLEIAKVMAKGQITIPKDIRDDLNINVGDKLTFESKDGNLYVKKIEENLNNDKKYILEEDVVVLENQSKYIYNKKTDEQINNSIVTMYYVLVSYLDYHKLTTEEFSILDEKYNISRYVFDNYYIFDSLPDEEMVKEVDNYVRSSKN